MNTEPPFDSVDLVWVARCYQRYKLGPYGPELHDLCEALDEMCETIGVTDAYD